MSKDTAHEKWLSKFNKTKRGKIFNLTHDVKSYEVTLKHYDKLSHLSSALSIISKGTDCEDDVKELITLICPEFYIE